MPLHPKTPVLSYSPGALPTKPAPQRGERLIIEVSGLPPYKEVRRSIRNATHPIHPLFVDLRRAATRAMAGRAWYRGPVRLDLTICSRRLHQGRSVLDYMSGVMDTLDGSHGFSFTYLPIVYEDDAQVTDSQCRLQFSDHQHYRLIVEFL